MARRRKRRPVRSTRRDWRQIGFYIISFLVVISMAIGYVLLVASPR